MKYYFLIILVCFYSSCATNQTSVNNDSDINVVDIDKGSSSKSSPVIDNDNNEHIGVGPSLPNSESVSINQSEKKNHPRKQGKKEGETDGCCTACHRPLVQAMPVEHSHVMHGYATVKWNFLK